MSVKKAPGLDELLLLLCNAFWPILLFIIKTVQKRNIIPLLLNQSSICLHKSIKLDTYPNFLKVFTIKQNPDSGIPAFNRPISWTLLFKLMYHSYVYTTLHAPLPPIHYKMEYCQIFIFFHKSSKMWLFKCKSHAYIQVQFIKSKFGQHWIGRWLSHCRGYYLGTLSCSQVSGTHFKIRHLCQ